MAADLNTPVEGGGPPECRLDSWKEVAAYLKRHVTTVRRWEKHEGLPVHRHHHHKLGSVYAFPSELNAWWRERQLRLEHPSVNAATKWTLKWGIAAGAALACSVVAIAFLGVPGPRSAAHAVDPAAFQEFTIGRYHLWRDHEDNLRRAVAHFERAVEIDPSYAAAYASLAHAWWKLGLWSKTLPMTEAPARAAAARARELDESSPAVYAVEADLERLYGGDLARAEGLVLKALALDPNHIDAHYSYGLVLMTLGRSSDAIAHMDTAARLDPLAPAIQSDFGRVLYRARKYDQAIVRLNRALELEPAMGWLVYHRLADVYEKQGQYDRAVVALRRAGGAHRLRPLGAELARVAARMGYRAAAEQLMRDMDQSSGAPLNAKAAAYAALGDHDTAFRLLFEHVDSNSPGPNFVAVDPLFDVLHSDPRWKELLRRIRHSPSAEARRVG